jgi:phosphotransferase system HPr-like phosphotransfer protein
MGMLIQLAILELIFRKITVLQSSLIDESSFIQLMLLAGLKGAKLNVFAAGTD